jgi:aminoglycoside phosphotransferase (APT) family kinase protein
MRTDAAVIDAAVARACGAPPASKTRVMTGFSNEVYDVETVDGQRVIVKLHHPWVSDAPYFGAERWALEQCARFGVPAPRLLLVDQVPGAATGGRPLSVLVQSRLPGAPLAALLDLGALLPHEARPVLAEVGTALARIHAVETSGFGRLDPSGKGHGAGNSLLDYPLAHLLEAAMGAGFTAAQRAQVAEAYHLLETHRPLWEQIRQRGIAPRWLHGDLSPRHIMVSDRRLSGLIDFEFPTGGDPAEELGGWDRAYGEILPVAWLLEGYGAVGSADGTFALRMAMHRVRVCFAHLGRENPPPDLLEKTRAGIGQDLQILQHEMQRWSRR